MFLALVILFYIVLLYVLGMLGCVYVWTVVSAGYPALLFQLIVFICPIAIAYSYGTDNKISLRLSVCLSVCHHSHGRISLSIFTKFDTEV